MAGPTLPNETPEYRAARDRLLTAEEELRAKVEEVATMRRAMPLGGPVKEDYLFESENGPTRLSDLFADDRDSLFLYSYMFSPQMEKPCPLCTSFLDALDRQVEHLSQRINVAVTAKSPLPRIMDVARQRGWDSLRLLSDEGNGYHADYLGEAPDGSQLPVANVFVRREGKIHHFWASELLFVPMQGGDRRHIDMMWPLWNVFDTTPEGRGDWYPAIEYD